jgi:hypothetical protein
LVLQEQETGNCTVGTQPLLHGVVTEGVEISEELWLADDDKSLAWGRYECWKSRGSRLGAWSIFVEFLQRGGLLPQTLSGRGCLAVHYFDGLLEKLIYVTQFQYSVSGYCGG